MQMNSPGCESNSVNATPQEGDQPESVESSQSSEPNETPAEEPMLPGLSQLYYDWDTMEHPVTITIIVRGKKLGTYQEIPPEKRKRSSD